MNVARLLPFPESLLTIGACCAIACSGPDRLRDSRDERARPPASRDAAASRAPAEPRPAAPDAGIGPNTGATTDAADWPDRGPPAVAPQNDASPADAAHENGASSHDADTAGLPVTYSFDVRVHAANTRMDRQRLAAVLGETQLIWYSQARICFEFHTVTHDEEQTAGFDVWYVPEVPDLPDLNGYIDGRRIFVRDEPKLSPARDPVSYPASRTTAHELGHGLGLDHYTDPVDLSESLMASKQAGYRLHDFEIEIARRVARTFGAAETPDYRCAPIREERGTE